MTDFVFVRRFLSDYARNPVNLLLLAVVPVVFVVVVAGSLANTAKLLGGTGSVVATASAGWAAAFLAGVAMYFQTATTRQTDRRLVTAGLPAARLVLARLLTGLCLAALASVTALVALAVRTGVEHPVRAIAGTFMFAVIYVAIGAVVGAVARNAVNGTVIVLFIWILDVFFGPAMGAADRLVTRGLPTHFVTLWMVDLPSGHGGKLGDLGWALVWTAVAWGGALALVVARTRRARTHHTHLRRTGTRDVGTRDVGTRDAGTRHAGTHIRGAHTRPRRHRRPERGQFAAAFRAAWRDARRNPAQWTLFVVVPVVFILTAAAVTPDKPINLTLDEGGRSVVRTFAMPSVHGATMAPIAIASLAALVGLFVLLDSRAGDRRAALAGLRPHLLLGARLGVLGLTAVIATAVSLATTASVFQAKSWPIYAAANLLLAATYGLVGALLAPIFGRVGGVFVAFLLPFLDIGVVQSPMLHPAPTALSRLLPGYGGSRVLLDGALTAGFDEIRPLLIGVAWVVVLASAVVIAYGRSVRPAAATR